MAAAAPITVGPDRRAVTITEVADGQFDVSGSTYGIRDQLKALPGKATWKADGHTWRIETTDDAAALAKRIGGWLADIEADAAAARTKRSRKAAETKRCRARRWTDAERETMAANHADYVARGGSPSCEGWVWLTDGADTLCVHCNRPIFMSSIEVQCIVACPQCSHKFYVAD